MGFFSADCTGCGHPLLSRYATNEINAWMERGVTIFADGSIVKGTYDGYGRYEPAFDVANPFGGQTFEDVVDGTVWHDACWKVAGSPTDFRGVSEGSADQGYFFDDPDHDMPEPTPAKNPRPPAEADTDAGEVDGPVGKVVAMINARLAALPEDYTTARHGAARALSDLRADILARTKRETEQPDPAYDVDALRTALGFLVVCKESTDEPKCERLTTGIGSCFTNADYTADARYGIDQACASCIAHYALTGQPIRTGPGRHAEEDETTPSATLIGGFANPLPEPMQPGWDPTRPGREAEARFLDACIEQGVDPREFDEDPSTFNEDGF